MSDSKNGTPAEKNDDQQQYSLNDDRRVKVLSPGALIAKRFFRNRLAVVGLVILVAMFLFSFVGGLVSPYGQDQTFSTLTKLNTQYAGITETTTRRYTAAPDAEFGALVQANANSAINEGATSFERDGVVYTIEQPAPDLYTFTSGGSVAAYASSYVVSVPAGMTAPSFDFQIAAITAISNAAAAGDTAADAPEVDESGAVVVDSTEGLTEQDTKIVGYVHEQGKPSVVLMNKWDLVEKDTNTINEFQAKLKEDLKFMDYFRSLYISAKTGQRTDRILAAVKQVYENSRRRIQTGVLNDVISSAVRANEPPSYNGRRLKIYYVTQIGEAPPAIALFVNDGRLLHFSYKRFLENTLRAAFDFSGTPIRIVTRDKKEDN